MGKGNPKMNQFGGQKLTKSYSKNKLPPPNPSIFAHLVNSMDPSLENRIGCNLISLF